MPTWLTQPCHWKLGYMELMWYGGFYLLCEFSALVNDASLNSTYSSGPCVAKMVLWFQCMIVWGLELEQRGCRPDVWQAILAGEGVAAGGRWFTMYLTIMAFFTNTFQFFFRQTSSKLCNSFTTIFAQNSRSLAVQKHTRHLYRLIVSDTSSTLTSHQIGNCC